MALRALDCMKNDGRAAIIIGGHTEWDEQGRIQAGKNRLFFNYLYSHYNVEDVIQIDGHKLYSRQGTSFDVRLILIRGRKVVPEGFAPLKDNVTAAIVSDFEQLWNIVFSNTLDIHKPNDYYLYYLVGRDMNIIKKQMEEKAMELEQLGGVEKPETGEFGLIYRQFKNKPKDAIKHLLKVKQGECINALYRKDIGYIDIVWGENDSKTNKGFGLKHIIDKHGEDIKAHGFNVEDFIPIIIQAGSLIAAKEPEKILLESNMFRVVILKEWKGKKKQFILTAFDLIKKK